MNIFMIICIVIGIISIFAYPVTKIISSAWHSQKLKELDKHLKEDK